MRARFLKGVFPALAMVAMAGTAVPAQAAFINTWSYTFSSSFSNITDDGGTGTIVNEGDSVNWGPTTGPRSSIGAVDTPTVGFVDTNGDPAAADDFFHDNNILPLGSRSLTSARLTTTITLTPSDPAGATAPALQRSFDINFFETPNAGTNGICADGNAVGSGLNSNGCADIFTLEFDFGQFDFSYDGFDYSLFLFEDPSSPTYQQLGFLPDAACSSVGLALGCFGFLTRESALTIAEFAISIEGRDVDVPEPAALGLLGLGLMGLGAMRRRRKA